MSNIQTIYYKGFFMKKRYCALVLLSVVFSTYNNSAPKEKTMKISEKCYQDWQNIREDAATLKYYLQGGCNGMGEIGKADIMPSTYLKWLRDESNINDATELKYMHATGYMYYFISDENYVEFDNAFAQKHAETQNVEATWNWFHGHLTQHLKASLEDYTKDMMERDAAKVTLAEQGIYFEDNGRTLVLDGDQMSEKPENMQKVKEALDRLYKE
jgi:hypothetical protein